MAPKRRIERTGPPEWHAQIHACPAGRRAPALT
jgi:hypothetical protein